MPSGVLLKLIRGELKQGGGLRREAEASFRARYPSHALARLSLSPASHHCCHHHNFQSSF